MRFLCEIIKGESWAEHTERESEILRDGERGREKRWRERVWRWFLSKTVILVLTIVLNQQEIFLRYRYWSYLHKVISRRLQILKSLVWRYFYFPTVFLVLMTSTRITLMFSTLPPCIKLCASKVLDAERKRQIF
jgi:hypothetical protein